MIKFLIKGNWSIEKLRHVVQLRFGLNGVKIAQDIAKVGVHACLQIMDTDKWSNFNSEKLVKSETPLCDFTRVGFKES